MKHWQSLDICGTAAPLRICEFCWCHRLNINSCPAGKTLHLLHSHCWEFLVTTLCSSCEAAQRPAVQFQSCSWGTSDGQLSNTAWIKHMHALKRASFNKHFKRVLGTESLYASLKTCVSCSIRACRDCFVLNHLIHSEVIQSQNKYNPSYCSVLKLKASFFFSTDILDVYPVEIPHHLLDEAANKGSATFAESRKQSISGICLQQTGSGRDKRW